MFRLTLLSLGLLSFFPAFSASMPAPLTYKTVELISRLNIRVGDAVNTAYKMTTSTDSTVYLWLNVNCQSDQRQQLFLDFKKDSNSWVRMYGASLSRYAPPQPLNSDIDLFATKPELDACHQNLAAPNWVAIDAAPDGDGNRHYLDLTRSEGNGKLLKFRMATDYAQQHLDEKYAAPYSVRVQDWALICDGRQGEELSNITLDSKGVVTGNEREGSGVGPLPPSMTNIADTLCAVTDLKRFKGAGGTLQWREKTQAVDTPAMPDFAHNDPQAILRHPLAAQVTGVMRTVLSDVEQRPGFRRLSFTQLDGEMEGLTFTSTIDVLADGSTMTLDKMEAQGVAFYFQRYRLFNLVDISTWDSMSPAPIISEQLENSFSPPPKPGADYRWLSQHKGSKPTGQQCHTGKQWRQASEINPDFPGRYLEVQCADDRGDGRKASSDYAWLADLRVFVRIGYQDKGKAVRFKFKDVVLKR